VVEAAGVHARDVKGGTSCWFACLTHTVDGARALEGRSRTESFVCRSQRGNRDRQADEQTKLFGFFFFSASARAGRGAGCLLAEAVAAESVKMHVQAWIRSQPAYVTQWVTQARSAAARGVD